MDSFLTGGTGVGRQPDSAELSGPAELAGPAGQQRRGPQTVLSDLGPGAQSWGPRPALYASGAAAVLAVAGWAVATDSTADRAVAALVGLVTLAATLAVVRVRRRLTAGPAGLEVRGVTTTRTVGWSDVTAIDLPTRRRWGLASTTLEVDLADETLLVFGRTDLGTDPTRVAEALRVWWRNPSGERPPDQSAQGTK